MRQEEVGKVESRQGSDETRGLGRTRETIQTFLLVACTRKKSGGGDGRVSYLTHNTVQGVDVRMRKG